MKALAINSSPRKGKGNTALILDPFLEGMKEAGAEVELYYTNDLKINPFRVISAAGSEHRESASLRMIFPGWLQK